MSRPGGSAAFSRQLVDTGTFFVEVPVQQPDATLNLVAIPGEAVRVGDVIHEDTERSFEVLSLTVQPLTYAAHGVEGHDVWKRALLTAWGGEGPMVKFCLGDWVVVER